MAREQLVERFLPQGLYAGAFPDAARYGKLWGQAWRRFGGLVAAWILAVIAVWTVTFIAARSSPVIVRGGVAVSHSTPVEVLSAWDGQHYSHIATAGYSTEGAERRRFAFFPLLPSLARLFGGPVHAALAGILLSQICLLGSLLLMGALAHGEQIVPLRRQPGFWLLVSPLGFFFLVFYTESLFLFLTLTMVVAYRKERFALAFTAGIFAGLTRPTAFSLAILFACYALYRWYRGERWVGAVACTVAPGIGIALYTGGVGYAVGDPLGHYRIQEEWWAQQMTVPFLPVLRDMRTMSLGLWHGTSPLADQLVRLFSVTSILALIAGGWRRLDRAWLAYLVVSMVLIHSREPHHSTARYELVLFPVFFLLAQSMVGRRYVAPTVATLLVLVQLKFLIDYASWRWVA